MGMSAADLYRAKRDEQFLMDEAIRKPRPAAYIDKPVRPEQAIPRLLGDELIDASRAAVGAYYSHNGDGLNRSIRWLAKLVGGAV
jgi:hypothetical protein